MKLKLDENGNVELKDGKPVYVKDDGTEIAFDGAQAFNKIGQLTGENTDYRRRFTEAEAKAKLFEGIEDPEVARNAIATMQNIDQGKLISAGKVEELKATIQRTAEEKVADVLKTTKEKLTSLEQERDTFRDQLHEEKIGGGFARSKFIQEKIAIPADMMRAAFGKAFKVEDGKTVAYGADGKPVYSKSKMGELADMDEALEIMVDQYPQRDLIMKGSGSSGSGAANGAQGNGGKKIYSRSQFNQLDPAAQRQVSLEASQGKVALTD